MNVLNVNENSSTLTVKVYVEFDGKEFKLTETQMKSILMTIHCIVLNTKQKDEQ